METTTDTKSTLKTLTVKTPIKPKVDETKKKFSRDEELGGIWVKEAKSDGKEYMTGDVTINGQKTSIIIFRNRYKENEKHPDFRIYRRPDIEGRGE